MRFQDLPRDLATSTASRSRLHLSLSSRRDGDGLQVGGVISLCRVEIVSRRSKRSAARWIW